MYSAEKTEPWLEAIKHQEIFLVLNVEVIKVYNQLPHNWISFVLNSFSFVVLCYRSFMAFVVTDFFFLNKSIYHLLPNGKGGW